MNECYSLSIAQWVKAGHIQPGCSTATDGRRSIGIDWTGCNYGGARPWFVCSGCNRRSGKLYSAAPAQKQVWYAAIGLPTEDEYRCRVCLGLAYQSASASRNIERTCHLQFQRLSRRMAQNPPAAVKQKLAQQMQLIQLRAEAERMRKLIALNRRVLKLIGAATGEDITAFL